MASASEFDRTYSHVLLYPPQADECRTAEGRERNFSSRMYGIYLQEMRLAMGAGIPISQSFLVWHRTREYDKDSRSCVFRGEKGGQRFRKTMVTACRYWYELTDGFWGQFVSTQIPHSKPEDILPTEKYLQTMINFFGMIDYVSSWTWAETPGTIRARGDVVFELKALPLLLTEENEVWDLGQGEPGDSVFTSERAAFVYIMALARRDLEYRGFRDDRVLSFQYKQEALYLLFGRVRRCTDDHEFEMYRQSWDTLVYAKYKPKEWHPKQQEALDRIRERTSIDDEEVKNTTRRFLYLKGRPGSGKTAVLIEAAVRAAKDGLTVIIVCPTGALVISLKELLPEFDGVERIHIDTIHAVLKYKRERDNKVEFVPPSGFRKYEAVFCDEASQYDDLEWERLFKTVREQPHSPYVVLVADFQQLRPLSNGSLCRQFCERMETIELVTSYRSTCPEHLLFLNRIRDVQPDRPTLAAYFRDRIWNASLEECVAYGLQLAAARRKVFTWLTHTNKGASSVCRAALAHRGVSDDDLLAGYPGDPSSKSRLRILCRPELLYRLTRNLDKRRGFVNGALAVCVESLKGNEVFIVRLVASGNLVLVHPIEEKGQRFLPLAYGYATTVRRAQGASLDMGCIYFDQKRRAAGRGYGYVAVSRFKSREGCFLYGKLKQTDFLPVGEGMESEILERGVLSETSDSDEADIEYVGARSDPCFFFSVDDIEVVHDPDFEDFV